METLRICIGTNDGEHIAGTHMGDTETFAIYDLDKKESVLVDQRQNQVKDLDHAQSDKMQQILNIVKDVDVLIAQQKSPNFVKIAEKTRYQPVVIKSATIQSVLSVIQAHFDHIHALVEQRQKGEFAENIPILE